MIDVLAAVKAPEIDYQGLAPLFAVIGGAIVVLIAGLFPSRYVQRSLVPQLAAAALVRSWLAASERRSVIYAWTPLILVALLVDSMFESFTLSDLGWFMLVLCALRAGQSRSWRENIDAAQTGAIPTLPPQR